MNIGAAYLSLLLCTVYVHIPACRGLREDWILRPTTDNQGPSSSRVFTGNSPDGQHTMLVDLQELKTINKDWAIMTSRNYLYVLDLNEMENADSDIEYSQIVPWLPENRTTCERKTADHNKCNNFLRVIAQMTRHFFLICGTNARRPKCREYQWNGTRFTGYREGGSFVDENKSPLDDGPSLVYIYTDGNFYAASKMGYREDPALRRTAVDGRMPSADFGLGLRTASGTPVVRGDPMPRISTDNNDASVLNNPTFVSAIESQEKVYIFFKEVAEEQHGNGEMMVSRVAQVCKNDRGGGKSFRSHRWTSYFKARLNCSVPGNNPFQFNELRHLTKPFVVNGVITVFAAMTTPIDSIWGSAVCAYSVPAIGTALNGDFMKRSSFDATSVCWSMYGQNAPRDHPAACLSDEEDTTKLSEEDLKFRKNHPLVKSSVQAITEAPLFIRTQARYIFTAIDAETDVAQDATGAGVTILYIGTSDGHLLKVVPRPFDTDDKYDPNKIRKDGVFVAEILVYNQTKCQQPNEGGPRSNVPDDPPREEQGEIGDVRRVRSVTAITGRNLVLVAFQNCVIAVPKHLCSNISCRKSCVQSGNPYCGWLNGECVDVTSDNRDSVEQDLFGSKTDLPECIKDTSTASKFVQTSGCEAASAFAIPLAVSLSVCFVVIMIALLIILRSQTRFCAGVCCGSADKESMSRDHSFTKGNRSWGSGENMTRGPIYKGPRGSSGSFGSGGTHAFINRASSQHAHVESRVPNTVDTGKNDALRPQDHGSLESVDSFSKSSDGSGCYVSKDRRKFHGVHIVEDVRDSGKHTSVSAKQEGSSDNDTNLNNNNTKRNIGIAYALTREETPLRRRSVSNMDSDTPSTPSRSIRMGSLSGTTAEGASRPPWRPQQRRIVTNPNFVAVSPMPPQKTSTVRPVERAKEENSFADSNSQGLLPRPPASGLMSTLPAMEKRLVSGCQNVVNTQNRTFGRGSSLTEPYYSETTAEPDYENVGHRKQSTLDNSKPTEPMPLPANNKPNRKLSSFTASHFNTSWYPAQVAKNTSDLNMTGDKSHIRNSSSSSGITSSSSSASTGCTHEDNAAWGIAGAFRKDTTIATNIFPRSVLARDKAKQANGLGKTSHSSDDGYGSGFVEDGRQFNRRFPSPPASLEFADIHAYDSIPLEECDAANGYEMPMDFGGFAPFENKMPSDEDDQIKDELGEIQWSRGEPSKESKKKFLGSKFSRKKSSKRQKRNNTLGGSAELSSPSDNDDVFAHVVTQRARYGFDHPEGGMNGAEQTYMGGLGEVSQTLDDSFVDSKWGNSAEYSNEGQNRCYAFHTMRPPGRMRQKLPRLRRGEKESEATLIAVPPPEIPKI